MITIGYKTKRVVETVIDEAEEREDKRYPFVLCPLSANEDFSAALVGPLTNQQILLTPSTQIIWAERGTEKFREELSKRFDQDGIFGHFCDRLITSIGKTIGEVPEEFEDANGYVITTGPLFKGDPCSQEHMELLKKRARREPVYIDRNEDYRFKNRWSRGRSFTYTTVGPLTKIAYDPERAKSFAKEEEKRRTAERRQGNYVPITLITKSQAKAICFQMRNTLLTYLGRERHDLYIQIEFSRYRKRDALESLLALYKMGRNVFGKDFWKHCVLSDKYRYPDQATINEARLNKERWKKSKFSRPTGSLASKVWDTIQDVSHARLPRRGK